MRVRSGGRDGVSDERPGREKRPYAKPVLVRVPLRPEEAVLGGCKTSDSSGPMQDLCSSPSDCSADTS